jgi:N-acyl-D-amino-acid deacylase
MAFMRPLVVLAGLLAGLGMQLPPPGTLLIVNGQVIDGTGAPPRSVAIRVQGDLVVAMAPGLTAGPTDRVIDASGLVVAPGFIDMHSHASGGLDAHPDAITQIRQGITTAVVGQDGGGTLPITDFFESVVSARPAINFATAVGHGTVRGLVLGADYKRPATAQEIETMKALVDRGMQDGAVGLTSGLEYDPGFYAAPGELVELARVAAKYGGFYASHVRDEENTVFDAWREAIDVGRRAGLPVEISHIKLASQAVWGRAAEALALIDAARREGIDVTADWYPYTYWQSSLYVLLPDRDFENRQKWTTGLAEIGGAEHVLVTGYRPDPSYNGRTLANIAAASGTDPVTLAIEMIRAGGPNIGIIGTAMREDDLAILFAHPQVLICSDGAMTGRHPRGYGAFPRVLGRYVRERKLVPLEDAIAKMTGRSAARLGLADRGVLAPGKKADIVIFDAATIGDRGTPEDPSLAPVGVRHVIVNGEPVLADGVPTGARPGRPLKRDPRPAPKAAR